MNVGAGCQLGFPVAVVGRIVNEGVLGVGVSHNYNILREWYCEVVGRG